MTAPAKARGVKFYRLNGSTYEEISEVTSIAFGGVTAETIDTTALAPTDNFRTFIPGLKSNDPMTVNMNLDAALTTADVNNQGLLKADVEGDTAQTYKIVFATSGPNVIFTAIATGFSVGEMTPDGKLDASFTCQPTGKPTWADS